MTPKHNATFLLVISALTWSSCSVNDTTTPIASESFAWMLENHSDKIASSDKHRCIIQIKVLDQIVHGARQCGYHGVRNFFYLAALSDAIKNRDANLINTLYGELHNVLYFKLFVEELANIKGCPISHFHENEPNEKELRELFQKASVAFPSSLSIEQIVEYGINPGNKFWYFKNPPAKKETLYAEFFKEMKQDFGFELMLPESLKELLEFYLVPDILSALHALPNIKEHKAFPVYINLQGEPGHAVSASVFMPTGENKPTFLFTDSWGNLSFLSGWSKAAIDVFYKLIINVNDGKNKMLFYQALMHFDRSSLMGHEQEDLTKPLASLLNQAKSDPVKKQEILDKLDQHIKEFNVAVKGFRLETATFYPEIKALVDKIYKTYHEALI